MALIGCSPVCSAHTSASWAGSVAGFRVTPHLDRAYSPISVETRVYTSDHDPYLITSNRALKYHGVFVHKDLPGPGKYTAAMLLATGKYIMYGKF